MSKLAVLAAAAATAAVIAVTGCGSAAPAGPATPAPTTMTLAEACQVLRANMVANGGQPDAATLYKIDAQVQDKRLADDAREAVADIGSDTWWVDAAALHYDCKSTGVDIPAR